MFNILIGISKEIVFINQIFLARGNLHWETNLDQGISVFAIKDKLNELSETFINYWYRNYRWWVSLIDYLPKMNAWELVPTDLDK